MRAQRIRSDTFGGKHFNCYISSVLEGANESAFVRERPVNLGGGPGLFGLPFGEGHIFWRLR